MDNIPVIETDSDRKREVIKIRGYTCMRVSVSLRKSKSWEYKCLIPVTVSRKDSTQFIIRDAEPFRRSKVQTVSPSKILESTSVLQYAAFSSNNLVSSPLRIHQPI